MALFMNIVADGDADGIKKPSIVVGYWLCDLCKEINWDNDKPLRVLKAVLANL